MFESKEEYEAAYMAACGITGYGLEVTQILACPFCCAPDYQRIRIVAADHDIANEVICANCKRGTKGLITRKDGGTSFEIVQTTGPDIPDWPWMPPIRRIDQEGE